MGKFPGPRGTFPQFPLATNHAVSSFLGGIGGKWGLQEFPKALVWHTAQAKSMILKGPGWLQEHSSTILADSNKKIIGLSSHGVAGMPKTAWLVVFGVPGKPFTWNHPGFHPGETVYPRETPGISSSGAKNKIGGVLGHACADSGPKSFEVGRPQASRSADYTEAPTLR